MKKILTAFAFTFLIVALNNSYAQTTIGASYEIRSEDPTTGFGLHVERDFLPLPLLGISGRLHFSYFSEDQTRSEPGLDISIDDRSIDVGLTAIASVNLAVVAPYAGVGIGMEFFTRDLSLTGSGTPEVGISDGDDSGLFYYGMIGLGISAIPVVRPFVEYRYRGVTSTDYMPSKYGTWAFGLKLRF